MATFQSVFGDGGNTGEINFDWQCEKCGEDLKFKLIVGDMLFVDWEAACCGDSYSISPYVACYIKL